MRYIGKSFAADKYLGFRESAVPCHIVGTLQEKKATVKEFTVTLSAKSTNSVYTPITRNAGWSVTGCSSAANENGSANKTGDIRESAVPCHIVGTLQERACVEL